MNKTMKVQQLIVSSVLILVLLITITSSTTTAHASSTLHWWPLEGGSLEETFSAAANSLELSDSGVSWVGNRCGVPSSAIRLDGTASSSLTPKINPWEASVDSFWVNIKVKGLAVSPAPTPESVETLFSVRSSTGVDLMTVNLNPGTGQAQFTLGSKTILTAPAVYTHGVWNTFGVSRNGAVMELWINGVKEAFTAQGPSSADLTFPTSGLRFIIGQQLTFSNTIFASNQGLHAEISDLRIATNSISSAGNWRRLQQNSTCIQQTLLDRPIVHYHLSRDVYDVANTGNGLSSFSGANTAIPGTGGAMCWPRYSLEYAGNTASHTNIGSGIMISGMQDFTYSLWFKETVDVAGNDGCITSIGSDNDHLDELTICYTVSQSYLIILNGVTLWNDPNLGEVSLDSRYYLVITRIGRVIRLYSNSVLKHVITLDATSDPAAVSPIGPIPTGGWWLGNRQGNNVLGTAGFVAGNAVRGYINDLQVFSFGISQERISKMYEIECQQLNHWFDFKDGSLKDRGIQGWLTGKPAIMTAVNVPAAADHCPGTQNSRYLNSSVESYLHIDGSTFHSRIHDFTIAVWFKLERNPTKKMSILSVADNHGANGLLLYVSSSLKMWLMKDNVNLIGSSSNSVPVNQWTHVAVTRDDLGTYRMYLDGEQAAEYFALGKRPTGDLGVMSIYLGHDQDSRPGPSGFQTDDAFQGWLRDVRFFNVGLDTDAFMVGFRQLYACPVVEKRVMWFDLHHNGYELDRSGHGVMATRKGVGTSSTRGVCRNFAQYWDGSVGDYIDCGTSAPYLRSLDDFSISFWMREWYHSTQGSFHAIWNAGSTSQVTDMTVFLNRVNGKIFFWSLRMMPKRRDNTFYQRIYSSSFVQSGQPYHISITREAMTYRIYVNGVLDTEQTVGWSLPVGQTKTDLCYFGQDPDYTSGDPVNTFSSSQSFKGYLQQFRIDAEAFPQYKVKAVMDSCTKPIAEWRMEGDAADHAPIPHPGKLLGSGIQPSTDACGNANRSLQWTQASPDDMMRLDDGRYLTGLTDFSIGMWIKLETSAEAGLISIASDYSTNELLMVAQPGIPRILYGCQGRLVNSHSGSPIDFSDWVHFNIVRRKNNLGLFVNGAGHSFFSLGNPDSSTKIPAQGARALNKIYINGVLFGQEQDGTPPSGVGVAGTNQWFRGKMRDVKIYDFSTGYASDEFKFDISDKCLTYTKTITPISESEEEPTATATYKAPLTAEQQKTATVPIEPPTTTDSPPTPSTTTTSPATTTADPTDTTTTGATTTTAGSTEGTTSPPTSSMSTTSRSSVGGNGGGDGDESSSAAVLDAEGQNTPGIGQRSAITGGDSTQEATFPWWAILVLILLILIIAGVVCFLCYKHFQAQKREKRMAALENEAEANARAEAEMVSAAERKNRDLMVDGGITIEMEESGTPGSPNPLDSSFMSGASGSRRNNNNSRGGPNRDEFQSCNFKSAALAEKGSRKNRPSAVNFSSDDDDDSEPDTDPAEDDDQRRMIGGGAPRNGGGDSPGLNRSQRSGSTIVTPSSPLLSRSQAGAGGSSAPNVNGSTTMLLSDYKKGKLIGSGGFGRVYKGMDLRTGGFVAAKEIPKIDKSVNDFVGNSGSNNPNSLLSHANNNGSGGDRQAMKLQHEIRLLASLEHQNVVKYLGSDSDDEFVYIFMEFLPGGSVRAVIDEYGSLSPQIAATYMKQALYGLIYLHGHSIVHRDIKAANLILDGEGILRLADFGCSDAADTMNSMKGTPYWMAPEAIRGEADMLGSATDIWSIGCVLIEMLAGVAPFTWIGQEGNSSNSQRGPTSAFQIMHVISVGGPPLDKALNHMPEQVKAVELAVDFIRTCCQFDPDDRPSATQLLSHPFLTEYAKNTGAVRDFYHNEGQSDAAAAAAASAPVEQKPDSTRVDSPTNVTATPEMASSSGSPESDKTEVARPTSRSVSAASRPISAASRPVSTAAVHTRNGDPQSPLGDCEPKEAAGNVDDEPLALQDNDEDEFELPSSDPHHTTNTTAPLTDTLIQQSSMIQTNDVSINNDIELIEDDDQTTPPTTMGGDGSSSRPPTAPHAKAVSDTPAVVVVNTSHHGNGNSTQHNTQDLYEGWDDGQPSAAATPSAEEDHVTPDPFAVDNHNDDNNDDDSGAAEAHQSTASGGDTDRSLDYGAAESELTARSEAPTTTTEGAPPGMMMNNSNRGVFGPARPGRPMTF